MTHTPKPGESRIPICKFVAPGDTEATNDILRRVPTSVGEWRASITRCMALVEQRLDDIERRILTKR